MIYSEERKRSYDEKIIMRYGAGVGMGVTTGFNLVKCYGIVYSMRRMKLQRVGYTRFGDKGNPRANRFFFFYHRFFR